MTSDAGVQTITYTGTTPTSFTGCSGGAGNISNGSAVQGTQTVQFLFSKINEPPVGAPTLLAVSRGAFSTFPGVITGVPSDGAATLVLWVLATDAVQDFTPIEMQIALPNAYILYALTLSSGLAGPLVELLVDIPLSYRAGPVAGFAVDLYASKRAGPVAGFTPDLVLSRRAGAAAGFTPDLVQSRRAGPVAGFTPDFVQSRRAGPAASFKLQLVVSGETTVLGVVLGTEDIGGVVHGEF